MDDINVNDHRTILPDLKARNISTRDHGKTLRSMKKLPLIKGAVTSKS